jgi:hypothetical protein
MAKKITQRDRVIQFMREHGSITAYEAFTEIGCTQLSARICELEAEGYVFDKELIKTKNRYGDNTHYYRYRIARAA